MKVLFFAQSRVAAGRNEYFLDIPKPVSQSEFWSALISVLPSLAPHQKTARLARHETYLEPGDSLQPADEIAIIPPVSGG
jgi:molybdopterin converting factor small subunit